ncbi:hypothetical protein E8E13_011412 [Curvularia kusanoi]|uniref:Uncharacterized protein n=1 Tax=Curvularia kusanoi TaxID=90978 RepID=A0A9P4TN25_CURKU|nr:hypothetical protein E8E13_011412 [Curvularia kusanoi]
MSQDATKVTERAPTPKETIRSKRVSYPETIVARPNLRVTVRPMTDEKLSRRPRSAFDLRKTPPPRPASEFRRAAVALSTPLPLSDQDVEFRVGTEKLLATTNDSEQRSGSITPGQRLAERFLKERKSATVLEPGVRKSTGKFVREDTPAFL